MKAFSNKAEFVQASDKIELAIVSSSKEFALYVKATIEYFYGKGDKNNDILNRALAIAHKVRGFNADKLREYMIVIVPCDNTMAKDGLPPVIGNKIKKLPWPSPDMINTHLQVAWCDYAKEKKDPAKFDWQKAAQNVGKKLQKAHLAGADGVPMADIIKAIQVGIEEERNKVTTKAA